MLLSHLGRSRRFLRHPPWYIAPPRRSAGDVAIVSDCRINYGASVIAQGGSIAIDACCVILENAVVRSTARHYLQTVVCDIRSRFATALLSWPSAHARMIRARRARCGAVRDRWANESQALVVRQHQRNFRASQWHPRLHLDGYQRGDATCFTFFAVTDNRHAREIEGPDHCWMWRESMEQSRGHCGNGQPVDALA